MEPKQKSYIKKVKRGKLKDISPYELLLRNSHELLWRKLSEYTVLNLGVVRVKVWFPDLKLASSIKLDRCASVDSAISYIARKKKITNPHCGLFLERHGEIGIWLENNTPLWLYDIQTSDVLEYKLRPAYNTTVVVVRVFIVEQKIFRSAEFDKVLKVSQLVAGFQNQFGLAKGDMSYYGFNLLTPEANEIWLEEECTLSSYLIHNMSVVEYKRKPIIVFEKTIHHASKYDTCVIHQNTSVVEAIMTLTKWLNIEYEIDRQGLFYIQQNSWLEKDTPIGIYPFKSNDTLAVGYLASDVVENLIKKHNVCARVIFAAPPCKNIMKSHKIASLAGEVPVFKVTNVVHLTQFTGPLPASLSGGIVGDITLTNYRLAFSALQSPEVNVDIPVASVTKVEKGKQKNEVFHGYYLDILCKDNRLVRFYWPHHDDSRKKLYHSLKQLAFPGEQTKLFAFFYEEQFNLDGWGIYNFEAEYERQKISPKMWRVSLLNANYLMCDSYPPLLSIPAKITDEHLREVFLFRSKGRIPVMTWQHPIHGTTISRCSQPLSGIRMTRCAEDEALIREIGYSARPLIVDKLDKNLYVLDCRPKTNAMGNRAKGAGYEDTTTSYPNCILEFLDIGNIHVMRESYEKLLDICLAAVGGAPGGGWSGSGPSDWLSAVESTKWLSHLCTILKATERVIDCVHHQEVSVLLHCSDGWDRTAQVASLALILLDPYHRTLRGFALLIEKEWLSFGHKFAQRNGHGDSKHADERSPVFIQFLDCVWQILQQFPYAFEFNESFLLAIHTHLHSCRFGTFLFNSHRERHIHNVRERTASIWSMLLSPPQVHDFSNLFYEPVDQVLTPIISARYMQLWTRAHLSWYCAIPLPIEVKLRQHVTNQAKTIEKLTRQIEELKCQIDPIRSKNMISKNPNSDLKLSLEPGRGSIFAKNVTVRNALLNSRANSGPLKESESNDAIFFLGNQQFSTSISSGLNHLTESGSDSMNSEIGRSGSGSLLRGDSPFGRRNGYSSTSSDEDVSDEDQHSSSSNNDNDSLSGSSDGILNPNNNYQYLPLLQQARSPSIGSRRQLEIPYNNSPTSSFLSSSSNSITPPRVRSPSPTTTHSTSPNKMPTTLTRSPSPTIFNSPVQHTKGNSYVPSRRPTKTASSPHISYPEFASPTLSPPTSPRMAPRNKPTNPSSSSSFVSAYPSSTASSTLNFSASISSSSASTVSEDEQTSHTPGNVATYINTNVANATDFPRQRGDTAFSNVVGVNNVANYISHNYNLSDSAKLVPRNTPNINPPTATNPPVATEEAKWQQVRRSPSARSLNFLDQTQRKLPPNTNPSRFSSS